MKRYPRVEKGDGRLRKMVLSHGMLKEFERIAECNTKKPNGGVETCGILAGIWVFYVGKGDGF